jgi:hypothetical protein
MPGKRNPVLSNENQQDNCNQSIVSFAARVCHMVEKIHFYSCPWPFHKCQVGETLYSSFYIPCNMRRNGCKSLAPTILLILRV